MELKATIKTKGPVFEGKAPEIVNQELTAGMYEAMSLIERNVKRYTPVGVYGAQGGLLGNQAGEVIGKGTPVVKGVYGLGSPYAEPVEKGRTAGKAMPPAGSLLRWIEVKMGLDERQAKRIEYVVRRKIGKKGFDGAHMAERGFNASLPGLIEIFDRRGFVIARRLS